MPPARPNQAPSDPAQLLAMLGSASDGVWLTDGSGRILEASGTACRLLGYDRPALLGLVAPALEAHGPDEARARRERIVREGSVRSLEQFRRADGTCLPVEAATTFLAETGQFVCHFHALSGPGDAQEQPWWQAMAASGLPLVHLDHATGRLIQVTQAYAEARGYRPEEMVGQTLGQVLAPPWTERLDEIRRDLERQGHAVFESINRRKDGSTFPVLVDSTLVRDRNGNPGSRVAYVRDITDLKRAESERQKSATLLRTLLDTLPDLVWLKDPEGVYIECNSRFERLFGARKADIVGRTDYDFVDREQADFFREHDLRAIAAGVPSMNEEVLTFQDDGHRESVETIKTPILDPDGRLLGVLGIGRDITARKAAEERLRISEEKYHQAFYTSPLLASLSRLENGLIIEVNDRYCQVLGYTREEVLGRTSLELGIFRPEVREQMVAALQPTHSVQNLELPAQTKDGREVPCLFFAEAFEVGGDQLLLVMALDIRETKIAEELQRKLDMELHQMQKLDSLGSLASGVAHDMNNVLAAIQAVSETLREMHGEDPGLARRLGLVDRACARGRDLVKGLTHFARKDLREPEILDLNAMVAEEMELLARTTLQKVRLVMDLEENLPRVMGERGTLASALMNLCVNAVDAMPGSGTLNLRTRTGPQGEVEVQVEDTGEGMAEAVLARAMEPFYTTKPIGKGTGMGLSMAYATLKAHGGGLAIESAPGRGTRVTLALPALEGGAESPAAPGRRPGPPDPADPAGGRRRADPGDGARPDRDPGPPGGDRDQRPRGPGPPGVRGDLGAGDPGPEHAGHERRRDAQGPPPDPAPAPGAPGHGLPR